MQEGNINTAAIDSAFNEIIYRRGIHRTVGRKLNTVLQLRYRHRAQGNVSFKTKLFFLQKTGIRMEQYAYTDKDLTSLAKFCSKASPAAKALGPAYLVEKWKAGG